VPDPRWSAQEVTQTFASLRNDIDILRSTVASVPVMLKAQDERIEVLEARILELEEELDNAT
jgi:predicted S18 family serine protease